MWSTAHLMETRTASLYLAVRQPSKRKKEENKRKRQPEEKREDKMNIQ